MHLFNGETADEVWRGAASRLLTDTNKTITQPSRNGETREFRAAFSITNPLQRWVISRQPSINPAFALAEVIWILNGRNDATVLNFFNPSLPKHAGDGEVYHGAYGFRLRQLYGFDQLERVYNVLLNNPESRQAVLQIWDPTIDLPTANGTPTARDIPCNVGAFLKIRDNKLEWLQILRSNDIFLGVPYNFVQFTTLQEIFAGWLNIGCGTYCHISDSLHIYTKDSPKFSIASPLKYEINTDSLALPKPDSDRVFASLSRCMDEIVKGNHDNKAMASMLEHGNFTGAYKNILRVLGAEAMRRSQHLEDANALMSQCDNPALVQTWQHWVIRNHPSQILVST